MFCQLSGINAILYYLKDIFAMAGATGISGDLQAIVVRAVNLVGTPAAMLMVDRVGRRKLLLSGTAGLVLCLAGVPVIFLRHKYMNLLLWCHIGHPSCALRFRRAPLSG